MSVHICVPVLNRYDLLRELLTSLRESTVQPFVHIIDNGRNSPALVGAFEGYAGQTDIFIPDVPMGVAESWNWFIDNIPEERLITNDDITFASDSIEKMLAETLPFVSCTFGFSCFLLRDACIEVVGRFDETISPGYAYFEDMDYLRRMKLAGVQDAVVQCGVRHHQSATPQKYSALEQKLHHQRFQTAEQNYTRKWASDPSWEQLKMIGGQGAHT